MQQYCLAISFPPLPLHSGPSLPHSFKNKQNLKKKKEGKFFISNAGPLCCLLYCVDRGLPFPLQIAHQGDSPNQDSSALQRNMEESCSKRHSLPWGGPTSCTADSSHSLTQGFWSALQTPPSLAQIFSLPTTALVQDPKLKRRLYSVPASSHWPPTNMEGKAISPESPVTLNRALVPDENTPFPFPQ